jgi:hypothetical protein
MTVNQQFRKVGHTPPYTTIRVKDKKVQRGIRIDTARRPRQLLKRVVINMSKEIKLGILQSRAYPKATTTSMAIYDYSKPTAI